MQVRKLLLAARKLVRRAKRHRELRRFRGALTVTTALAVTAPLALHAPAEAAHILVKEGMRGAVVAHVQELLIQGGYLEGAADGVGLGHDFLRHVERTKLILHIVDAAGIEGRDPVEDYAKINVELKKYSEKIARRTQVLVANKIDLPEAQENLPRLKELAVREGLKFFPISAATREGIKELIAYVGEWLEDYVEEPETEMGEKGYEPMEEDPDHVTISRNDAGDFIVSGKALEKLVRMTNFSNDEAVRRFQYIWRIKGIDAKLVERGIKEGQTVRIGAMEFEYRE